MGKSRQLIAQVRSGSNQKWNRYWEKEENERYDLCLEIFMTSEHLLRECMESENGVTIVDGW